MPSDGTPGSAAAAAAAAADALALSATAALRHRLLENSLQQCQQSSKVHRISGTPEIEARRSERDTAAAPDPAPAAVAGAAVAATVEIAVGKIAARRVPVYSAVPSSSSGSCSSSRSGTISDTRIGKPGGALQRG